MQLPTALTLTPGHAPYRVPAAAEPQQPGVQEITRPSPVSVANGPALQPRRVTFSSEVQVAPAPPASDFEGMRFQVSPVSEATVQQAPPPRL
ncbi:MULTISPECIES: hypothetical protein [Stenotrophomonas]|uniref:hypothetical protein n=1 Tax=Stenotrophomonas TaxID=40323 RepID=UPI0008732CE3|nr:MULTISPECIES: hypothetical protein [Stenotrophomonas]